MVKAPGRVTFDPIARVRNPASLIPIKCLIIVYGLRMTYGMAWCSISLVWLVIVLRVR